MQPKSTPLFISLIMGFLLTTTPAMAIEEPKYTVLTTDDAVEVRQYAPMLIAEVLVEGDMDEATNKGFRLIAGFIFGNNHGTGSADSEKIAMTAPVTVEPQATKIAMTAPVTVMPQVEAEGGSDYEKASTWRVNFVMPSQYTLANIPKPKNDAVQLREIPGKYFVVLGYSGFNNLSKIQRKIDEALAWANKKGMQIIGTPQLSRYNPPWTLPMFRRNEIMVEIAAPSQ